MVSRPVQRRHPIDLSRIDVFFPNNCTYRIKGAGLNRISQFRLRRSLKRARKKNENREKDGMCFDLHFVVSSEARAQAKVCLDRKGLKQIVYHSVTIAKRINFHSDFVEQREMQIR